MKNLLVLLVPVLLFTMGCTTAPPREVTASDFIGTWQSFEKGGSESDQGRAASTTVTFAADGSIQVRAERADGTTVTYAGTFVVVPPVIMVNYTEGAVGLEQFPFEFDAEVLTIFDGAADAWMKFRRKTG